MHSETLTVATQRLFGTDGMRGIFGRHPLDEPTIRTFGRELALYLGDQRPSPRVVLGGDTRDSTPTICRWLAAGLGEGGASFVYLRTVPTPCVAYTTRRTKAACGIAVSASHNPHPDNGIKLISGDGFKWSKADEASLETRLLSARTPAAGEPPTPEVDQSAVAAYLDHLITSVPGENPFAGLTIALDAAHGAAAPFAAELFTRLGANTRVIGDQPDGRNINFGCGSTHPQPLADLVQQQGCQLGFAFDGDADRAILVDDRGEVRDGDAMLYLWARHLDAAGELRHRRVVGTAMSNLGLELSLGRQGITLERCDVGDRHVVEALRRGDLVLGGEQSGHLIDLNLATTGDGLLSAVQIARIVATSGRQASDLLASFERCPQVLVNVRVSRKPPFDQVPGLSAATQSVERSLQGSGRLLLRYSGTEPKARIMIEGTDGGEIESMAAELAAIIEVQLG